MSGGQAAPLLPVPIVLSPSRPPPTIAQRLRHPALRIVLLIFLGCLLLVPLLCWLSPTSRTPSAVGSSQTHLDNAPMGEFSRLAVTTDHTACAHIGKDIMVVGGNAVDASIASMFCLGVMNPMSSGLGGGFLLTLFNSSTGKCVAVDARETAPAAANETMFTHDENANKKGYLAIGVPSELAGYWEAFNRFGSGKVKWADLVAPTIKILEEGVPVSTYLAKAMKQYEEGFRESPTMRRVSPSPSLPTATCSCWLDPSTNSTYKEDERMFHPQLLRTLYRLANASNPTELFYRGEMADEIEKEMKRHGGILTKTDLASYKVRVVHGLTSDLGNGLFVCGGPLPSGFAITQLIVSAMSRLYPNASRADLYGDTKVWHNLIEAMKFAMAQRSRMGDGVPEAKTLAHLLVSPAYVEGLVKKIKHTAQEDDYYGGDGKYVPNDHGTSHVSVLDGDGNGVSVTTTINRRFGALVESESLGILWNNEMDDFSTPGQSNVYGIPPAERNFIFPGKRPLSSMSPLVVFDKDSKKVRMVAGSSGGVSIPSSLAQVVTRTLVFGDSIKEAIDAPRVHNQFLPNVTRFETRFNQSLRSEIEERFNQTTGNYTNIGVVQGIEVTREGLIRASGDFRRETNQTTAGL